MAKSLHIAMFVSIVLFFTSYQISSQEIDQYSQEVPEDVKISPASDFDIYVESPDEPPSKEADSPAMEYGRKFGHHYTDKELAFFKVCFQKLNSSHCGDDLFKNMVDDGKPVLLAECCGELLKIGKYCYLGMAQFILSSYEFRNIVSKAIPKSKQTWSDCVRVIENQNSVWQFDRL
ncbi:downregulated in DIF1 18 [Raphanus sativus]|uniref:Protein DOWN-REGULATED IN DIF1 11 n=1 Tax=Raphanus sativus TaxID=3726 RepID=A0A6J0NUS7_RAPSA|nr:protein DOWN-REGULATED IN DIF1 11 [Raphanus sativus]KAJ4893418.1 downregulated in DIF1 18 [Raphanus sativus]